jgi:glutamyl-tRNA synthetase
MSKRHGAVSVNSYIEQGIKSSALVRYLCQLGLDTGNDDLRLINDIIKDFEIKKIVKSPARFDSIKLNDICGKILRKTEDKELLEDLIYFLDYNKMPTLTTKQQMNVKDSLPFLKIRSKNFQELYEQAKFIIINDVSKVSDEYENLLTEENIELIKLLSKQLKNIKWIRENINNTIKSFALKNNKEFKDMAKLIRIAIVGTSNSPGIYDMMIVLGKSEVIRRFTSLGI